MQFKAVADDVAYRLEWERAKHGANRNAAASRESYVSSDSTPATCGRAAVLADRHDANTVSSPCAKQNPVVSTRSVKVVDRELAPFQRALKLGERTGFDLLVDLRSEQYFPSRIAPRDMLDGWVIGGSVRLRSSPSDSSSAVPQGGATNITSA